MPKTTELKMRLVAMYTVKHGIKSLLVLSHVSNVIASILTFTFTASSFRI